MTADESALREVVARVERDGNPEWAKGARYATEWLRSSLRATPVADTAGIDLAADIRAVDGNHDLGAGARGHTAGLGCMKLLASLALGIALGVVAALYLVFWRSGAEPAKCGEPYEADFV